MNSEISSTYQRWKIPYDEENQFNEFKNRVLHSLDVYLGVIFLENSNLQEELIRLSGILPSFSYSKKTYPGLLHVGTSSLKYIADHTALFNESRVWDSINQTTDLFEIIKCIQSVAFLQISEPEKNRFFESIKRDVEISGVPVGLKITEKGVVLYPKGAKLLDHKVVNDVLDWLSPYVGSQENFRNALIKYQEKKWNRNLLDDLRLSLELLLKKLLNNSKSLENQRREVDNYLGSKNVPTEVRNMFWNLLDRFSKYQNEYVKHDDNVREEEIEFMIYLTGTFMRFLLLLNEDG